MKSWKGCLALAAVFIFPLAAIGQTETCRLHDHAAPREKLVDFIELRLEVSFVPEQRLVKGTVWHTFTPMRQQVDSLVLDAPNISIGTIEMVGDKSIALQHQQRDGKLVIRPSKPFLHGKEYAFSIQYEAHPQKGIYFIGWDDTTNRSRKQIWTQGQGTDNRHWIPMFDDMSDKVISDITVVMPSEYMVLGNGNQMLKKADKKAGTTTWRYRMPAPHAPYLIMLGIGDYAIDTKRSASGIPVQSWYYPQHPEHLEPTYRYTLDIMKTLEEETGMKYPWPTYAQIPVQEFLYGAMENTTATVFGDFFMTDGRGFLDRKYVGVNAHEMAHQWFGDLITAKSQSHVWLQESFATHYAKLCERRIFGDDHWQWNRWGEAQAALGAGLKNDFPVSHSQAGTARIYQKGSFVLDMLKDIVGEEDYRRSVKHYLETYAHGNVNTDDFQQAFYDVAGHDLGWFFDQWIYRGGEPHFEVSYHTALDKGRQSVVVQVKQIHQVNQTVRYFRVPVTVQVFFKDGSSAQVKEWADGPQTLITLPNSGNKEIDYVLFDPGYRILKRLTFQRSYEELAAQAAKAANMIDRYQALAALRATPIEKKRELLLARYRVEQWPPVLTEILEQLKADNIAQATSLFNQALAHPAHQVRQFAVNNHPNLEQVPRERRTALLGDTSYNTIEAALRQFCTIDPNNTPLYVETVGNLRGINNNIRIAVLEMRLQHSSFNDNEARAELTDLLGNSWEFRTRLQAFEAIRRLHLADEKVARNLMQAATSANGRLARPAVETINALTATTANRRLFEKVYKSLDDKNRNHPSLKTLFSA